LRGGIGVKAIGSHGVTNVRYSHPVIKADDRESCRVVYFREFRPVLRVADTLPAFRPAVKRGLLEEVLTDIPSDGGRTLDGGHIAFLAQPGADVGFPEPL